MTSRDGDRDGLHRALRQRLRTPTTRRAQPRHGTWPEAVVADWLDRWSLSYSPQHELLPGLTVDFWLPAAGLVIECQGSWHHGDPMVHRAAHLTATVARKRRHDAALQAWCRRADVGYVEVWEAELRLRPAEARERLAQRLGLGPAAAQTPGGHYRLPGGLRVELSVGCLTDQVVDGLVHATSSRLALGGGPGGALARRAGPLLQAECDRWLRRHGPVPTGGVALTAAGNLRCRAVLHAVCPWWRGGGHGECAALVKTYRAVLAMAAQQTFQSLAVEPDAGADWPRADCLDALLAAVTGHDRDEAGAAPRRLRLVARDGAEMTAMATRCEQHWPAL